MGHTVFPPMDDPDDWVVDDEDLNLNGENMSESSNNSMHEDCFDSVEDNLIAAAQWEGSNYDPECN